ncbi:MAG: adenylosuccinate lyase [Flavobacteriaceae bacterium]|nr:adenylosuccinate lyase [Flavobacteriaceae bacterium]
MTHSLFAISPIDGRYQIKTKSLSPYFSEAALIKYRVRVEIEYFIALAELGIEALKNLSTETLDDLRAIYLHMSDEEVLRVKEIEKITNHDVKAVEYFIKEAFQKLNLSDCLEFVHFGLTSQDINNTAIPLSIKEALNEIYFTEIDGLITNLSKLSNQWSAVPMLARTHGQPASPTRLGKEIDVFIERLKQQLQLLKSIPNAAKFGGATGNFNAHSVAFPKEDWIHFGKTFVEHKLGLHHSFPTTQIEHYDHLAAQFDSLKRINTILIDFCRDVWTYISMDYFKQKINKNEVGSSAMPHKVNPIDFENAEGNLGIANALFEHLSAKLPVSRLQRDLTDSTVLRNVGVPFSHTLIALNAIQKGLNKLVLNATQFEQDLENNWAVVAEAIQTILRRENYPNPYEALKTLTRKNNEISEKAIKEFISTLEVSEAIKVELNAITPSNYTGI